MLLQQSGMMAGHQDATAGPQQGQLDAERLHQALPGETLGYDGRKVRVLWCEVH